MFLVLFWKSNVMTHKPVLCEQIFIFIKQRESLIFNTYFARILPNPPSNSCTKSQSNMHERTAL